MSPQQTTGAAGAGAVPDLGLFGPGSTTWRLHADPLLGVALLRSLLLYQLDPRCGRLGEPGRSVWDLLARICHQVAVTTYGTTSQALMMVARMRVEPGLSIDLDSLLWRHCCFTDSVLSVLCASGADIDDDDRDRYLADQVRMAALTGLDPPQVPHDTATLDDYLHGHRPRLAVSDAARANIADVLHPPAEVIPMAPSAGAEHRPPWAAVAGLAFAALPWWARRTYAVQGLTGAAGLKGSATTVALHALRGAMRGLPPGGVATMRPGPQLRSARQRLAAPDADD